MPTLLPAIHDRQTTRPNAEVARANASLRWRWWYSGIADLMINEPSLTLKEIAAKLDKAPATLTYVVNSDMFKTYLEQRKAQFQAQTNGILSQKMTAVATAVLDLTLERLEKKRDTIPFSDLMETGTSMLDRLGYAPQKGPAVVVNTQQVNQSAGMVPVSSAALEEARAALRLAESRRAQNSPPLVTLDASANELEGEVGELPDGLRLGED